MAVMTWGEKLVYMIVMRRMMKCLRDNKHTFGYCAACGVHD